MPVFNGERYLADAIGSVLQQDFRDLELIITNASTDRTEAICRELGWLTRGSGISAIRGTWARRPTTTCASSGRAAAISNGRAITDRLGAAISARAVAALEARPEAVLCTVGVVEIDAAGAVLRRYANDFPGIDAASPARRFAAVIHTRHQCEDFFGLFRRAALTGSDLHGAYNGSDRVLLAEMALRGPWVRASRSRFSSTASTRSATPGRSC